MGNSINVILNRIATFAKEEPAVILRRLYWEEMLPAREIGRRLSINHDHTLPKLLDLLGIPRRTLNEALVVAWKHNPARRQVQAERIRTLNQEANPNQNHWAKGRTKLDHPGIARTAEKNRELAVAKRPEMREQARTIIQKRHTERPNTHVLAKVKMTKWEAMFGSILDKADVPYVFNMQFPPYWVDFYLPDYRIGIELYRNKKYGMVLSRHTAIESQGITLYYVQTMRLKTEWQIGKPKRQSTIERDLRVVQNLIQGIKTGIFDPAMPREHFLMRQHD